MTVRESINERAPLENVEDIYPLSPMQQGMLFHTAYERESGTYLEQSVFTIDGDLDVAAFKRAWKVVLDSHSILRSSFLWEDLEKPLQVVHRDVAVPFKEEDWRDQPPDIQTELLQDYLSEDRRRGFDLGNAPLLRVTLFRTGASTYKFVFSRHHIVLDRWSRSIVLKDLFAFYESIANGEELRPSQQRPYGDYISWLAAQDLGAAKDYWHASLEGFTAPTSVAIGKVRESIEHGTEFHDERIQLSETATARLRDFARQHKLTLNTLTQAAWAVLLGKYAREKDVVFGVTVSGRPATLTDVESMVGLFINTLPLRVQLDPGREVLALLKTLQEQQFALQQYEYCSLVDIQGWSEVPRGVPLFESILVFENLPVSSSSETANGKFRVRSDRSYGSATGYPLTLLVSPGVRFSLQLVYDRARFRAEIVARMLLHLETILQDMVTDPERPLSEIGLLRPEEKQRLLFDWNQTKTDYDREICVHELFERQAFSNPSAVAVTFRDQQLTYGELNTRADKLAIHLRSLGVGPETLVGICLERSLEMVVGLIGILKAGGTYVPLDPAFPLERLAFIIKDSNLTVLVTQKSLLRELPAHDATVVTVDAEEILSQGGKDAVVSCPSADNLVYVIYTSGSTGKPKGVAIEHRALTNFLLSVQRQPGLAADDVLLAVTTLSFDIAGLEIYLPLITGARVVIADAEVASDGIQLKQLIANSGATAMQATPATWQMLINAGWQGQPGLKVLCGGDALSVELANALVARGMTVWNMYGPTETTVWSTIRQIEAGDELISIGRPIANTQIYLLDEANRPVPVGIAGELHIGGDGVGRGYLDAELTAEKFIPNIFGNVRGARLYKTGDLARYTENGDLEYLGRIDNQVKIRGYRIELGEIEAVLGQHSSLLENVVIAREDTVGDKRLVAYVVMADGQKQTSEDLREFLRERLPEYMLPAAIVHLSKLPLTPNGKVNRRALPAPDFDAELQDSFVAPRTQTEELLASIWSEVLKVSRVGVNDNFFELGGHSLLAVSMISRVRDALSVDLKVRSLFEAPTVARLARTLDDSGKDALVPSITRVKRTPNLPLSFAQERLWFLDQLESESPFYNVPAAFRLTGSLDVESLRKAFEAITMRHEALRTTFPLIDGNPMQLISSTPAVAFTSSDLTSLDRSRIEVEIRERGSDEARKPFDLQRGPLLRVKLLKLAESEYILLITTHHIVSDGWSIGILARELTALYEEFAFGRPAHLPNLSVQYVDYAIWQREWLHSDLLEKQVSYWKRQLHGAPALLELPKDRPRPAVQTFNGARRSARLSPTLTKALNDLSRREGATLFMTLLAAYQTLLWRYSGQSDVVVGTPVAGRISPELEGLIGFFVNTLIMRSDLSANPSFRELLSRVRETALEAYAHQDLPFERLVDAMQPERSLSHTPLFQVTLVFQNAPREAFDLGGLKLQRIPAESRTSKFDLTLFATEAAESLNFAFEYNTDLFDDARIERMLEHLQTLIEAAIREPNTRIGSLEILPEAERTQLLFEWNETEAEYRRDRCLHELFEEQAQQRPAEIALVRGTEHLSYEELNRRANQLAHYLKKRGVGPEVLVGICVKRGLEMVVGILGILKAGGAYVPLDPEYPRERLRFMLEDAKAGLLLTQEPLLQQLPETSAEVVCLDRDWEEIISEENGANAAGGAIPGNLAYVIYTSGTTGQPKGVAIEHRSGAALLGWARTVFTAEELNGVLASTSICFDLSVFELFLPLSCGGKVLVADDVLQLLTMPAAKDVKLINTVPSAMTELLRLGGLPESVETVNLAGEPLAASLVEELYERPHIKRVYDLYGPSEDTTYSTYALRVPGGRATIGRPIANTRTYLLDRTGQPVPMGVAGEVYLGGAGVARGYLQRPELTAQVFVPDPFSGIPGARLYKTGDLGRYLEDGTIEYLGRFDNQLKLRGFRIEIGEIEGVIKKYPQVSEVIVLAREDQPGDKRLVAYVVPNRDAADLELKQDLQGAQVSEWRAVWNETYTARSEDPTFNIVGWNNSYTGEPIPSEEMREWVDRTVDRILDLRPDRVLEIGCGTGLLLFRIAPHCTHYHGTDLSGTALDFIRQQVSQRQPELQNITLTEQSADEFGGIEAQAFDTVILNSVVQYFPSADYLVRVLEGAAKCLKPGGTIFLGDLRNLPLQRALHTSVQLHHAPPTLPLSELQRRVQKRVAEENELVIDPAFFSALQRHLPQISRVDIQLKRGVYQNELNKFRYDVVLHVDGEPVPRFDQTWLDWRLNELNINKARQLLVETMPDILAIRGVPDARLAADYRALTLLDSEAVMRTADELREAVQRSNDATGVNPEEFYALVNDLPYAVELTWAGLAGDGTFDVVLRRRSAPYAEIIREQSRKPGGGWDKYANDPLLGKVAQKLQPALRTALMNQLPEYMTPSEFVFLNSFPLTPNGKIDRLALPEPGRSRPELEQPYVAPRTAIEKELAGIWTGVLRRETVGIKDNFFELGGHSLLATQIVSRIREQFQLDLPLRSMFESPTIIALASVVAELQQKTKRAPGPELKRRRPGANLNRPTL